jgi:hypothetical protein
MQTTLISLEITWLLGILITLIFGSYGWTTGCTIWLSRKIEQVKNNHIKHVEDRLRALELHGKDACADDCEFCQ